MSTPTLLLVVLLALAGCGSGGPASPGPTGGAAPAGASSSGEAEDEVELRFDETVDSRGLELRWLELEDSRCPTGVTCVWAGQIVVTLEVARGEDGPVELELVHRVGREPEAGRAFDHDLRLLGVEPHPKKGVTPERSAYRARIAITGP